MIANLLTKRATFENPQIPLGDEAILDLLGGGSTSSSGMQVNGKTILGYPALWRAISLISRDVAKLPLFVYKRVQGMGKTRDTMHPAYRLLRRRPMQNMTSFVFRQTLMGHALVHGNGYAYVFRDSSARPTDMVPLDPTRTSPVKEDGRLLYVTTIALESGGAEVRTLLPENVVHIKGLGWDGFIGYSVIDCLRESLGLGLALQKYGSVFFRNNAKPSIVIEMPGKLGDEMAIKRLRESWGDVHQGLDNSHKPAILEQGAQVKPLSINNDDAQFLESRNFEIRQVANIIGVPPHKLGDDVKTAYNSLESENQSYLQEALDPWLCNWEAELESKLFTQNELDQDSHVIEFQRDAIIRVDKKTETDALVAEVNNGLLTLNEARSIKNMPPIEGVGDAIRVPLNHDLVGEGEDVQDDDGGQRVLGPLRDLLESTTQRMVRRIGVQAQKAAKEPGSFNEWLGDGLSKQRSVIVESVGPVVSACVIISETTVTAEDLADDLLARVASGLNDVSGQVAPDALHQAVRDWMAGQQSALSGTLSNRIITKRELLEVA